jgi:hypothetical protein
MDSVSTGGTDSPAPAAKVALLSACDEGTLTMSADGRRFVCAERTAKSDLFLLENFGRYRP